MRKLLILFGFFSLLHPAWAADDSLQIIAPGVEKSFTLKQLKAKLPVVSVTVDDPVYHRQMTYDGFLLTDVLKLAGMDKPEGDELVFQAKDGYSPTMPMTELAGNKGVLAFQEHGNKTRWEKIPHGKQMVSPAPYYLVWEGEKKTTGTPRFPWPYQLVKIELVNFSKKFDKIFPQGISANSKEMKGFLIFKSECIRCHSINLQGGDMAPELNIPKNITEYWDVKTLREFIRNPESFRLKSKMPPFPRFTDSDLDGIIAYFELMKEKKVLPAK